MNIIYEYIKESRRKSIITKKDNSLKQRIEAESYIEFASLNTVNEIVRNFKELVKYEDADTITMEIEVNKYDLSLYKYSSIENIIWLCNLTMNKYANGKYLDNEKIYIPLCSLDIIVHVLRSIGFRVIISEKSIIVGMKQLNNNLTLRS